jgi:catechol 2,3-dioxygenase
MSIPQTNFSPPFNITRASHMVFTARDLPKTRDFYVEVVGLLVTDEDANTLYMRGVEESCHHSLTIKKTTGAPMCERVGLRVFTDEDLDKAKAHFDRLGKPAKWVEVPHQGRTLHVSDAAGAPLELCASMEVQPRMHTRIKEHKGAAARRMDHFQMIVPNVREAAQFYMDLGFRISDYMAIQGTDNIVATFLYRKDNPWDVVLLMRDGPRFHHFGYVIESMADMIRACDVTANTGFEKSIEHGPARHGATHAYYTYLRDPDGHRVELLLPAIQLIDIEDVPVRYDIGPGSSENAWGYPAPRSWVEEASLFPGVTVKSPGGSAGIFEAERTPAQKAADAAAASHVDA